MYMLCVLFCRQMCVCVVVENKEEEKIIKKKKREIKKGAERVVNLVQRRKKRVVLMLASQHLPYVIYIYVIHVMYEVHYWSFCSLGMYIHYHLFANVRCPFEIYIYFYTYILYTQASTSSWEST